MQQQSCCLPGCVGSANLTLCLLGEQLACWAAGEQQRIGMARLFFHKPKFGVLDECTNATSVDVEEHLYQYAAQLDITLVTITQRLALVKYHDAELRLLDGEGDWELRQIIK